MDYTTYRQQTKITIAAKEINKSNKKDINVIILCKCIIMINCYAMSCMIYDYQSLLNSIVYEILIWILSETFEWPVWRSISSEQRDSSEMLFAFAEKLSSAVGSIWGLEHDACWLCQSRKGWWVPWLGWNAALDFAIHELLSQLVTSNIFF